MCRSRPQVQPHRPARHPAPEQPRVPGGHQASSRRGHRQGVHGPCVCYKWRPDIGKGQPGQPPKELDWNVWQGPAQEEPFIVNAKSEGLFVHYNWHWHWAYGNGDIGNQGVHQLDAARWGLGVSACRTA